MVRAILPDAGPLRVLVASTLVNTTGSGMFMAIAVLYYTRVLGLSAAAAGVALSVAALVAVAGAAPLGHLSDRYGPRRALVTFTVLSGVIALLLLVIRGFWPLLVVLCLWGLAQSAARSARGAVIAETLPPSERSRGRAYLRSVVNAGVMLGTVFAGVALYLDTPAAYRAMVAVNGVAFVIGGLICLKLPPIAPTQPTRKQGPVLVALRDRPYLAVAALNGVLAVHYGILDVALPLWIVDHTAAPAWLVAALLALNCAAVVLFQVRASRGTDDTAGASRSLARSGVVIGAACVLYALGAGPSAPVAAVVVLVLAAAVHVIGELWQAAGGFGISYSLAPEGHHGQYQGVFGMGMDISRMVAPVLMTTLPLTLGGWGWGILAGMFVLTGTVVPVVIRWAERSRTTASLVDAA